MTELIIRKFIKNHDDIQDQGVRAAYGVTAGIVGVVVNIMLFITKLIVGTVTASVSVTADAFNNLSDVASSVVTMAGSKLSGKPADADHPFGHGRLEYITALIVSFLVLEVGLTIFKDSVMKIIHPEELNFSIIPVAMLVLSILAKVWLSAFNKKLGRKINSGTLLATSLDARNDCISTGATIMSLVIFAAFKINIDGFIGVIVSVLIIKCGIDIAIGTIGPLIGGNIDPGLNSQLEEFVMGYENVLGVHDTIVHNYGPGNSYATIHVEVSDRMGLEESHVMLDGIEKDCFKKLGIILVTHTDPIDVTNEDTMRARAAVIEAVDRVADSKVKCHDVRVVSAAHGRKNVVFDLVVPFAYTPEQNKNVTEQIKKELRDINDNYDVIITVEHSYAEEK